MYGLLVSVCDQHPVFSTFRHVIAKWMSFGDFVHTTASAVDANENASSTKIALQSMARVTVRVASSRTAPLWGNAAMDPDAAAVAGNAKFFR